VGWVEHLAWESKESIKTFGERPVGRSSRWNENINMDLREMEREGRRWMDRVQ